MYVVDYQTFVVFAWPADRYVPCGKHPRGAVVDKVGGRLEVAIIGGGLSRLKSEKVSPREYTAENWPVV